MNSWSVRYVGILCALALPVAPGESATSASPRRATRQAPAAVQPATPASRFSPAFRPIREGFVRVETATGQVTVQTRETAAEVPVRSGILLPEGSVVRTGPNGRVFLRFSATDVVRLSPRTELKLTQFKSAVRPGRTMTILTMVVGRARAILRRPVPSTVPDFALTAGGSICAVKGTDFEQKVERAADGTVTVTLRVDAGSVVMLNAMAGLPANVGLSGDDVGRALGRGLGSVTVGAGQGTKSEAGGAVEPPARVPPRTALEIVSTAPGARVLITVNGVTTEAQAGDEVPPGAKVQVAGGDVVLSSGGQAVAAGDGATFTYTAVETPASAAGGASEVQVVIVVASDSKSGIGVECGTNTMEVGAGTGIVATGASCPGVISAADANAAAVSLNSPAAPPATTEPVPPVGTLSAPPPPAEDELPGGDQPLPDLPTLNSDGAAPPPAGEDSPPPPPPDTVNQDVPTVSPAAP